MGLKPFIFVFPINLIYFILLISIVLIFSGCPPSGYVAEDESSENPALTPEPVSITPDPTGPCCEVSAHLIDDLEIFVNGLSTGVKTPGRVLLEKGDLVYLSSIIRPGVQSLLIEQGEIYQNGAWVVDGTEKFIHFANENFEQGILKMVNIGDSLFNIGLDLNRPLSGNRFETLVTNSKNLKVLYIDKRRGKKPGALKKATNLFLLDWTNSDIDRIGFIAGLKELRGLFLSDTSVKDISPLSSMENLRVLEIDRCAVSDLSSLISLRQIRVISLRDTKINDLSPLKNNKLLMSLDIQDTGIKSLSPLKDMVKMRRLFLAGTKIASISPLKNMTDLEYLNIDKTPIRNIGVLEKLTGIKILLVRDTEINDFAPLKNHPNLEELYLDGSKIKEISFAKDMPKLRKLSLVATEVSNIRPLYKMKNLKWVSLVKTNVPKEAIKEFREKFPEIKVIGAGR